MPEFKLTKRIVFEATLIVNCADGLAAATHLFEWTPKMWTMRDGDEVRSCRGHFHVMHCGEDISIPGDPFATREAAEAAIADEQAGNAAKLSNFMGIAGDQSRESPR